MWAKKIIVTLPKKNDWNKSLSIGYTRCCELVAHSQLNFKAVIFLRHLFTTVRRYGLVKADHYRSIEEINLIQPLLTIPLVSVSFLSVGGGKLNKMEIIRDEEMSGLMMIPLLNQWGINRCNVRDCNEKPTTIITGATEHPFGLCEKHYSECKITGKINYTLDWCALANER